MAREVIRQAQKEGLDREKTIRNLSDADLDSWIQTKMYDPSTPHGDVEASGAAKLVRDSHL